MQTTPSFELLSELRRTASWKTDPSRTPIEHLLEYLLTGSLASNAPEGIDRLAGRVLHFDIHNVRVVVFGGGTGLSTIIGGNSQMPGWPNKPDIGVKTAFHNIDIVVCTTDDGGSTGQLLKTLPIVGIGDIRKILLSSILLENLQQKHAAGEKESGITIHYVDELYDHGKIILQTKCPVEENDSPVTLADKIHQLEHLYYPEVLEKVCLRIQD